MLKKLSTNMSRNAKTLFGVWIFIVVCLVLTLKSVSINPSINESTNGENEYHQALLLLDSLFDRQADIAIKLSPEDGDFSKLEKGFEEFQKQIHEKIKIEKFISPIPFLSSLANSESNAKDLIQQSSSFPKVGDLISRDSSSFLILIQLAEDAEADADADELHYVLDQKYSGIQSLKSFSILELEHQIGESLRLDLILLSSSILVFFILILIFAYRSWQSVFFCLAIAAPSVLFAIWCFSFFEVDINLITLVVVPITIVLALADAVHLLTGFNSRKNEGETLKSRISKTIETYISPSFLTSLTTSIAFYSFLFNESVNLQKLGIITGTAVIGGFFLSYLLGPILLSIIPARDLKDHPFSKLSRHFAGNKKVYSIFIVLLFVVSIFCTNAVEFKSSFTNFFPKNTEVLQNHNELERDFYSQIKLNLLISRKNSEQTSKREMENWVQEVYNSMDSFEEIGKANYQAKPKKLTNQYVPPLLSAARLFVANGNYVSKDENTHRIEIRFTTPDKIKEFQNHFLDRFKEESKPYQIAFASPALVMEAIDQSTAASLLKSLSLSTLIIVLVISFLTKSITQTLYALLANMTPLSAILLLFWLFNLKINVLTAITAVVCLGLIVDDTLHVIYRKVKLNGNLEELGFGMILTSLLLTGGFLLFNLSSFGPTQTFGNISSVIFCITLVSDLTLLPLLLQLKKQVKK